MCSLVGGLGPTIIIPPVTDFPAQVISHKVEMEGQRKSLSSVRWLSLDVNILALQNNFAQLIKRKCVGNITLGRMKPNTLTSLKEFEAL